MKYTILFIIISLFLNQKGIAQTTADYGAAFAIVTTLGIKLDMPLKTALAEIKGLKKSESIMDFRSEYTYTVQKNGLKELTFYFDKDNHEPLYEIMLEFDNADTLAAVCASDLGPATHPRLDDHWIIALTPDGLASVLWRFENRIVMAANLAGTELADDYTFQFDQPFIDAYLKKEGSATDVSPAETPAITDTPDDLWLTQTMNQYIENALTDFEALKGVPIAGKKDEYLCILQFGAITDNTIIRKKDSSTWRLEAKIALKQSIDDAKSAYNGMKSKIESLEALDYRLTKKSEYSTNTGNTYIWDVQNHDGDALGILLKLQLYAAGDGLYSVRMEVGK